MPSIKKNRGFTLIETLIYIALFSLILLGGFVVAFELIQASDVLNERKVAVEESYFVMRKFDWAMNGARSLSVSGGSTLSITNAGHIFIVTLDSGKVTLDGIELTTENVEVESLVFDEITGPPAGVTAVLTIDGLTSTTTKYIKE